MSDGSNWGQPPAAETATPEKPWNKLKSDEKKALDPARAKKETRNALIGVGVLLLIVGGCSVLTGGDDNKKELTALQSKVSQLETDLATAKAAQNAAETAAAAKAEGAVAADRARIVAAQAALDAREKKISGAEEQAKANQFDGTDGTYLVGADIKPGTYRGTPSDGCYYARLASLDGSDIIDNNNTDGPVVVQIKASDKAFQVRGCGTFTRIGN